MKKKTKKAVLKRAHENNELDFKPAFENAPAIMFIVDADTKIITVNRAGRRFVTDKADRVSRQPGNFFGCLGSLENSKGCGYGKSCKTCMVRGTAVKALKTGRPVENAEADIDVMIKRKKVKLSLKISARLINKKGRDKRLLVVMENITQFIESEKIFTARNEFLEKMVENLNDGIVITAINKNFTPVFINRAVEKMLEVRRLKKGRRYAPKYPHIKALGLKKELEEAAKGAVSEKHDVKVKLPSGKQAYISYFVFPFIKDPGEVENIMIVLRDTTRSKEAEERYKTVADYTYDWEYWQDAKGKYRYISPAVMTVTGYTIDDFISGRVKFRDLVEPEFRGIWDSHLEQIEKDPSEKRLEVIIKNKKGNSIWISHICRPVYNEEGEYLGRRAGNRNITEQKMMEQALKNSQMYFRALIEESSDIVFVLDNDLNIKYASPSVRKVEGIVEAGLPGSKYLQSRLYPAKNSAGKDTAALLRVLMLHEESTLKMEVEVAGRVYELTARDLTEQHYVRGIVVNMRDITEKKKTDERLKRIIWELERSNEELEQFAYVASHDLKEPLRSISNYIELIAMKYSDKLDEDGRQFVEYLKDGSRRMYDLIQGLLAYSRVGKKGPDAEPVDLNSVAAEIIKGYEHEAGKIGFKVSLMPKLHANSTEMKQLFQNLISNAVKFSSKRQEPKITVDAKSKKGFWEFCVSDNGIGIDPQYREKIFGLFERLHSEDDYPGTGLGLTICRKIVSGMGGGIWAESRLGKGTKIFFKIPKILEAKNG